MSAFPVRLLRSKFKREKAIEIVLYIANRIPDPTFHSISKIIYFGDKNSLDRYGRLLTDDTYCAMQYGPVPSKTYDLMKDAAATRNIGFTVDNEMVVKPLREAKLDELSDSDIESLDAAIASHGHVPFHKRTKDSHDKAWEKAWASRGDKNSSVMSIESIVALLENPDELLEHLKTQHDDSDS